jgi:thymidylate kinase
VSALYRLALIGIDGSGKTTAIAHLRRHLGAEGDIVTIHSPSFHENPNAPLQRLSRQMREVSLVADEIGAFALKVTMLYLQMTLYGAVERGMVEAFRPRCVVSDRHALVDTLAYGSVYKSLEPEPLDREALEPLLRSRLGSPESLDAAIAWQRRLERRLGGKADFWNLALDLDRAFDAAPAEVMAEFGRRYATAPPDAVVLLDVDPAETLRRAAGRRSASSELHEDPAILEALRGMYEHALDLLVEHCEGLAVHRIDGNGLSVEETAEALLGFLPTEVRASCGLQSPATKTESSSARRGERGRLSNREAVSR